MKFSSTELMAMAMAEGEKARYHAPPNPWVGALVVSERGVIISEGHTQAPGESHAEIEALRRAGEAARGATMVVTLEPCSHVGRTGPCAEAIIEAGVARVIVAIVDPDPRVSGRGIELLKASGIDVEVGIEDGAVREQLAPYIWHRLTSRPYVVAKVASTLDGIVAMADGSSQWITGEPARRDAHVLRAQSQAILVGAGTVRNDDPSLTARLDDIVLEPLRVVLGTAPKDAKVRPCLELSGELGSVLDELAHHDVLQLLIEGGPTTTSAFLEAGWSTEWCGISRPRLRVRRKPSRHLKDFRPLRWMPYDGENPGCRSFRRRYSSGRGGLMALSTIEEAIDQLRRGGMVIVVDDEDRENEGDLVMAAEDVTPDSMAFFLEHTSGVFCVPLESERADRLDLPLMVAANTESQRTAFTVSVDAAHGTTTGISAHDRAATVRALVDPETRPKTSIDRVISSPCDTVPVACCVALGTPKPPWTCVDSRGRQRWGCCARL